MFVLVSGGDGVDDDDEEKTKEMENLIKSCYQKICLIIKLH